LFSFLPNEKPAVSFPITTPRKDRDRRSDISIPFQSGARKRAGVGSWLYGTPFSAENRLLIKSFSSNFQEQTGKMKKNGLLEAPASAVLRFIEF
jgi:hypothetical protein